MAGTRALPRTAHRRRVIALLRSNPVVTLLGARQVGKTTLAMIVAEESKRPLRMSSGPAIQHAGDLAAVLSYVRSNFGNTAEAVTSAEVAAQRAATTSRTTMWTAREIGLE